MKTPDKAGKSRVVFIDVLRGYAILMMLQGHVVGVVLAQEYRNKDHWFYGALHYLKGLTAPVFFIAAGITFTYLMLRREERGLPNLRKGVSRGGWLILVGFLIQWKPSFMQYAFGPDWAKTFLFMQSTHVLHTVGVSLILITILRACIKGRAFYVVSGVLAFIVLLLGCVVYEMQPRGGGFSVMEIFFLKAHSVFPVMPWCGFAIVGAILGGYGWERRWFSSPIAMLKIALVGACVLILTGPLVHCVGMIGLNQKGGVVLWRAGEVMIFTAGIAYLCHVLKASGGDDCLAMQVFRKSGSETFVIYVLHTIILYGSVTDFGVNDFFSDRLGPWATFGLVCAFWIVFVRLAFLLPGWRARYKWLGFIR